MKNRLTLLSAVLSGLFSLPAAAGYSFITIDGPGAFSTTASSINDSGQVAGGFTTKMPDPMPITLDSSNRGFVYSSGVFTTLGAPGASGTAAISINASGQVAGYYSDASWHSHGFVYSGGVFTTLDAPGAFTTYAASINASGQVAGYYLDANNHYHGFIASAAPVPEPEEYLMLLLGFGMVGYQVKRKQRSLSLAQ